MGAGGAQGPLSGGAGLEFGWGPRQRMGGRSGRGLGASGDAEGAHG